MAFALRPAVFGIIGGAGPMAGLSLNKQLVALCQKNGAWKDADFPLVRLVSYPFAEMLEGDFDKEKPRQELDACLRELEKVSDYIIIACNTLHLFLPARPLPKLINLIELMQRQIPEGTVPLIVASQTSAEGNLHGRLLGRECEYWNPAESQRIIDLILRGEKPDLSWLFDLARDRKVILGCTEYSLAMEDIEGCANLIDPFKLAAQYLLDLSKIPIKECFAFSSAQQDAPGSATACEKV